MQARSRAFLTGVLLVGWGLVIEIPAARAQGPGPSGSLGGYGGSMTDTGSGMGMGGPVIPYAGKFGGFMPYRMGGGGRLSFQSRGASPLGSNRASFSLSPMSDGMSSMSGEMGQGLGTSSRTSSSIGTQGAMGLGGGMRPMSGARGAGVMPPSFGYPFRQPPSLLTPPTSGMGMSM
jgi:hypothetical protein